MGFGRREFLGITAGLAAGAAASPAPWRIARDLTRLSQEPPWLPGLAQGEIKETATVSLACPSGLGVTVLTAEGRPLLVRGNPAHPLSRGAITPPAQAEAYNLYNTNRIFGPLLKNTSGEFEPVSWAAALDLLTEKITAAKGRVMAVGPAQAGTSQDIMGAFMGRFGPDGHFFMPSEAATARAALTIMGAGGQPGYDLDNAKGLVLLGADVFESMPASPHFRKAWAGRTDVYSAYFGPARGATSALCGQWQPLPAGEEARLAMGLAWHLADMGLVHGKAGDLAEFLALVRQRFGPEEVQRTTGITPATLRQVAGRIADGALPVPGSPCGEGLGLAPFVAGLALSVMTGRVNRPGGVYLASAVPGNAETATPGMDLAGRLKDIALGLTPAPEVLLLMEADPVAGLPSTELVSRGVAKAGFKVGFAALMTASTRLCDLLLPAPMPLERWDDVITPYGLAFSCYGLARPMTKPGADVRHPGDVLLELAVRLGQPLKHSSFRQALRQRVFSLETGGGYMAREVMPWQVLAGQAQPAPEADLWKALAEGHLWAKPEPARAELSCGVKFLAMALAPEVIDLNRPLKLAFQASLRMGGPGGVLLQSVTSLRPDEVLEAMSVARLNAATARQVRVKTGERIRLSNLAGALEALVDIDESVMDGHVALLLGLGDGLGSNVRQVLDPAPEPGSGLQAWAGCRVRLERV